MAKRLSSERARTAADSKQLRESQTDKKLMAWAKRLPRGGMSMRAIAAKLAAEGYLTRRGRPMTKSSVGHLLKG